MKEEYSLIMNSIQNICYLALMLARVGFCKSIDENVSTDDKIVGGVPITSFEKPYQVSIQHIDGRHNCGGSLISRQHVLTAAHCIDESIVKSPEKWKIMAGYELINESSPLKQYRMVESSIIHENYGGGDITHDNSNDIAIIKVSNPFDITETVKLATLRLKPTKAKEPCTISGWGYTDSGSLQTNKLLMANTAIQDHQRCQELWKEGNTTITDSMICAGKYKFGTGVCSGDSGGPLVCNNELTGITSFGLGVCGYGVQPDVYTEVYHYIKWINKHLV